MMNRALEICGRALFKHVILACMPNNAAAITLYNSLGFARVGQVTSYMAPWTEWT
jgi:ribosomal protein S18 acetylase RimI-like enzyme